jgi:hypothetical protein
MHFNQKKIAKDFSSTMLDKHFKVVFLGFHKKNKRNRKHSLEYLMASKEIVDI